MANTLGQLLKDARKRSEPKLRGRRAWDVAGSIGVHPATLGRWEHGETRPSPITLQRLMEELGLTPEERREIWDAYVSTP